MGIREAIKGFTAGLRTTVPNARAISTMPGTGQIEVVDTSAPPTRYNVPGNWSRALLGPGQPFSTDDSQTARGKDAENEPRSFQYISSVNSTMSPRLAYGLTAFSDLRAYAESVPEVSMCLRLLTEEMKAFVPTIVDDEGTEVKDSPYEWMVKRPDGFNPFPVWLSKFLYNTLIYDAGCAYMIRNSRKKIVGSRVIDGSTIFVVIDERGEQPRPPAPAFQQIIWGVPRLFMNTRQLWYKPRHLRADAPYGRSPIEDSLPAVKLLQSLWEYEYEKYQVGNIPEMVFTVPENWKDNVDAILEFELAFNARMAGNSEERVRARFLPAGMNTLNTKELTFNRESYESATNAVRMSFGILQSEVGEGPDNGLGGKGYAEAMQSAFYRMGLAPLISYVESHFNDIISMNMDEGVEFKMEFPAESLDPSKEEEKFATRFQIGGIKRDEYRQGIGMEPLGGEEGDYLVQSGGGGAEGEDPFGMGAGAKPGMLNVGNKNNVQVRRPVKVLNKPIGVLDNPVPVSKSEGSEIRMTPEQAKEIGDRLGVDWDTFDLQEFTEGLGEEHEHAETVEGDIETMARITLDHLKEDPQYYTKLKETFSKFDSAVLEKMVGVDPEDDMLFGAEIVNLQDVKMPKQGANTSMIISIGGGSMDARPAVWKPVSGEKLDLQDYVGGELFRRSEAVYLLDRELASNEKRYLVPLSYMSQNGDDEGSVQHYISHRKPRKTVTSYEPEWIERAAVLDYISGQLDRKQKNYLTHPYNEKRPILIDNELSFSPDPSKRIKSSFVEAMRGEPLSDTTLDMIYLALGNRDLWEDLLTCLDDEQAVENARNRAQQLLDEGMLPKAEKPSRFVDVLRAQEGTEPEPQNENIEVVDDLAKADFEESKHPRHDDGRFAPKGTGGGGSGKSGAKTPTSTFVPSSPATTSTAPKPKNTPPESSTSITPTSTFVPSSPATTSTAPKPKNTPPESSTSITPTNPSEPSSPASSKQGQFQGLDTSVLGVRTAEFRQKAHDLYEWHEKVLEWELKNEAKKHGDRTLKYSVLEGGRRAAAKLKDEIMWSMEQPKQDYLIDRLRMARACINKDESEIKGIVRNFYVRHVPVGLKPVSQQKKVMNPVRHKAYFNTAERQKQIQDLKNEVFNWSADKRKGVTHFEFYGDILWKNSTETKLTALVHVSGRLTREQREHNLNIGVAGASDTEYQFVSDTSKSDYARIASTRRMERQNKQLTSIHDVWSNADGRLSFNTFEPTVWEARKKAQKGKQPAGAKQPAAGQQPAPVQPAPKGALGDAPVPPTGGQIDPSAIIASRKFVTPERKNKLTTFASDSIDSMTDHGGGVNDTYKVKFSDGSVAAMKPLPKDYHGQYGFPITEAFTSDLAEELGMSVVPTTGYRRDPKVGLCSVMDWVSDAREACNSNADLDTDIARESVSQMVAITVLTGNADRHQKNWMINDKTGEIYAIDNGFSLCMEVIGNDPWHENARSRAIRAYESRMDCHKRGLGRKAIPGWRIKPEHMKACEDFMADDKAVEGLLRRHFATDDLVHVIKNFEKKERPNNYVYANKTDEEIKEIAVKRGMKQLKEGLKVLREKYDEQKLW